MNLKLPEGQLATDTREILSHALSFYQELYTAETCDLSAQKDLPKDVPQRRTELPWNNS